MLPHIPRGWDSGWGRAKGVDGSRRESIPRRTELGERPVVGGSFMAADVEAGVNLGSATCCEILAECPPLLSLNFPQETLQTLVWPSMFPPLGGRLPRVWNSLPETQGLARHILSTKRTHGRVNALSPEHSKSGL